MGELVNESGEGDDNSATIQALLDAIELLGDELSGRDKGDLTFRVNVPTDPPAVRVLAELINEIGDSVDQHLAANELEMLQRTKELTQAYNVMQEQNEEMRRELEMARRIQERLLPQKHDLPDRPEISAAGHYQAMSNVGGDLYDIIRMGRNSYAVLIADVSGHGVPAALITALVKIAFRSRTSYGASPSEICQKVNEELTPILGDLDYFVTAWFGVIDLETSSLRYTNAGHDPALLLRTDGSITQLDSGGRFLGQFEDQAYQHAEVGLMDDDMLLLYTDGIVEARNLLDEEYGFERLEHTLINESFADAAGLVAVVKRDLENFCMGNQQRDDLSIFAIDFRHPVLTEFPPVEAKEPPQPAAPQPVSAPAVASSRAAAQTAEAASEATEAPMALEPEPAATDPSPAEAEPADHASAEAQVAPISAEAPAKPVPAAAPGAPIETDRAKLAADLGRQAVQLIKDRQLRQADSMLKAALVLAPNDPLVLLRLAALSIMQKKWDQANCLLASVINPPKLPDALYRQYERLSALTQSR